MKKLILIASIVMAASSLAASDCVEKYVAKGFTVEQAVRMCYPPKMPAGWFFSF